MTRGIVIINQAANYLTVGFANAFAKQLDDVALITGSVHVQGEELLPQIHVTWINRWYERPVSKKALSYIVGLVRIWMLLVFKYRRYDVFFVSVPPMGYLLNLILPHRFSMVIWDIYPDVLKVTGMREPHWLYRLWGCLNRHSFGKAWRIFTISDTLAKSLAQYVDRDRIIVHPIWSIFQTNCRVPRSENAFVRDHNLDNKFVVQYSGNIGITHNVEAVIDIARRLQDVDKIMFQIIGRGPRLSAIERRVRDEALRNVQLLPFQSDENFPCSLSAADLGIVILHETVSQGSVPSKAFNLMSFGIPSLYIAAPESELARYAEHYGHAKCFSAADLDRICQFITSLAEDSGLRKKMEDCAEHAAKDFRRANADRYVDSYLADDL